MPDQQDNSNPQGPNGPARAADQQAQTAQNLKAAIDALGRGIPVLRNLAELFTKLESASEETKKNSEGMAKKARDWSSELRQVLVFADDIEDRIKAVMDHQKVIAKYGFKVKDWKEAVHLLREMEKSSDHLTTKGPFSKEQIKQVGRYKQTLKTALNEIESHMHDAFDLKFVQDQFDAVGRKGKQTARMLGDLRKVQMRGMTHGAHALETGVAKFFGKSSNRVEKWHGYAQMARDLQMAKMSRHGERQDRFKARREDIMARLPGLGIDLGRYRMPDGSFDRTGFQAWRDMNRHHIGKAARQEGFGRLGSRFVAQGALDEASGERPGWVTRYGNRLLSRGEGSLVRGVLSEGGSLLEGGAGGLMGAIGVAAPVIAGLEFVKDMFDKNNKMNSEVASQLGQGGIFGGGQDAINAMRSVRKNLNGPLYSRYGIGYEKNLAIAKAMVDNGISASNLTTDITGQGSDFRKGSFGTLQRNAYSFGRLAGLDPTQTTAETIKLATVYGRSMEQTEDFYIRANRDAKAAGITTSKYIDLLDQQNASYDRTNKLLMTSVDTLRLLTRTGREGSDALKDALDIQTNGGQKMPLEMSAFVNSQLLSNPETQHRMLAARQLNYNSMAESLSSALGGSMSAQDIQKRFATEGYGFISSIKNDIDKRFANDPLAHQGAITAANNFQQAAGRLDIAHEAIRKGGIAGGLGLAVSEQQMGDDQTSQSLKTLQSVMGALAASRHNPGEIMTRAGRAAITSDLTFQKYQEMFGLDPAKTTRGFQFLDDIASGKISMAQSGMTAADKTALTSGEYADKRKQLEDMFDFLKKKGANFDRSKSKTDALRDYANTESGQETMTRLLPQMQSTFEDFYNSPYLMKQFQERVTKSDKDKQMQDTAKLVAATRPTAEIFADAFTSLFNSLSKPLEIISRILSHHWGGDLAATWSTDDQKTQIENMINSGAVGDMLNLKQKNVEDLQSKVDTTAGSKQKQDLQNQLQSARDELTKLQNTVQTFQAGKGISKDDAQGILNATGGLQGMKLADALKSNDPSQALIDMGIKIGPEQGADIDDVTFSKYQAQLRQLDKAGKIRLSDQVDPYSGKTIHNVYNTYNSVDMTKQTYDVKSAVNNSGETAKKTVPVKGK